MRSLGYWLGALYELVTGWPWKDVAGALVLAVAIASVYAVMIVWTP